MLVRGGEFNKPVHIINIEIKDNHEEAQIAGRAMLDLAAAASFYHRHYRVYVLTCQLQIEAADDIDENMNTILEVQQEKHPHNLLHAVAYY